MIIKLGRHIYFLEIHEVRKGIRAFIFYCALRMLIGWAGKLQSRGLFSLNLGSRSLGLGSRMAHSRFLWNLSPWNIVPRTGDLESNSDDTRRRLPREPSGITMMAQRVVEKCEDDKIQDEWQLAARVINKLFMIIYLVAIFLSIVGIFLFIPGFITSRPEPPLTDDGFWGHRSVDRPYLRHTY